MKQTELEQRNHVIQEDINVRLQLAEQQQQVRRGMLYYPIA